MKKRNLIAIIMASIGIALIVTALVLVYVDGRENGSIDYEISEFFIDLNPDYFISENSTTSITIMKVVTYLGEAIVYIAILVILYYVWDKKKAFRAIVALVSSTVINASAKLAFKLPRPDSAFGHTVDETSYGLPSGHTQMSTTFWGVLGSLVAKWGMIIVSILLPLLIAFSRIFLVVHWFTDVLMGFGIGLIFIAIFLVILQPLENYFENKSIAIKILWSLVTGIILATPVILLNIFPSLEMESMVDNLKYIAVFITVAISYSIEGKIIDFDNKIEKWWKGVIRVLLAIIVLAGVYVYGEFYDPEPVTNLKMILDLVVFAILGPILILFLPWLMKKLKL